MFCAKCGTELPDDAKFCVSCGKEVVATKGEDVPLAEEAPPPEDDVSQVSSLVEPQAQEDAAGTGYDDEERASKAPAAVATTALAGRPAFLIAYFLGMLPTYFLPYLGSNSALINAAGVATGFGATIPFWLHLACFVFLIGISWIRGAAVARPWLFLFPLFAAFADFMPVINWIPLLPTLIHFLALILGATSKEPVHGGQSPIAVLSATALGISGCILMAGLALITADEMVFGEHTNQFQEDNANLSQADRSRELQRQLAYQFAGHRAWDIEEPGFFSSFFFDAVDRNSFLHSVHPFHAVYAGGAPSYLPDPYPLELRSDGYADYEGTILSPRDFRASVQGFPDYSYQRISFRAHSQAPFGEVVTLLSAFDGRRNHEISFEDNVDHRSFDDPDSNDDLVEVTDTFLGETGPGEFPVVVSYLAESNQCSVSLSGRTVSSNELYDQAFSAVDGLLRDNRELGNTELTNMVFATVQSDWETPWRCVAGALFNIKVAGYPVVRFEMVGTPPIGAASASTTRVSSNCPYPIHEAREGVVYELRQDEPLLFRQRDLRVAPWHPGQRISDYYIDDPEQICTEGTALIPISEAFPFSGAVISFILVAPDVTDADLPELRDQMRRQNPDIPPPAPPPIELNP